MASRITLLLAAAAALAGCATPVRDLGLSVQNNIVAQVVDLEPVYAGVPIEGSSGRRAADAVKRYNDGAVKALAAPGGPK